MWQLQKRIARLASTLAWVGLFAPLAAGTASAVQLLEARVTVGGEKVLEDAGGTVRLEQPQLDALDRPTFVVPEPEALWQLGSGAGLLALLARRRRGAGRASRHLSREVVLR